MAQRYPDELCEAICRGAAREREYREQGLYAIGAVDVQGGEAAKRYEGEHEEDEEEKIKDADDAWWEGHPKGDDSQKFYDNVTGKPLVAWRVLEVRKEEIKYFRKKTV